MTIKAFLDTLIISKCPSEFGYANLVDEDECSCDREMCRRCWDDVYNKLGAVEVKLNTYDNATNIKIESNVLPILSKDVKEMVQHPNHYNSGKYEVIDVIDDWKLGFYEGNVIKYVARAKHKGNEVQDLKKAKFYLDRLIELVEGEK